ncbi:MAG: porin [Chthoniobacterales bacterium]
MTRQALFRLVLGIAFTMIGVHRGEAQSDAERLEKLERAVELLQKRNLELEQEVRSLKRGTVSTPVRTPEPAPKPAEESKPVAEHASEKKERKPVFATAAASELKLTLGGFIQAQAEAGDVFAFEGRFAQGTGEIKDRFRIRRGRISLSGDYTEHFDFKAEGEFSQSDTALTVRDANGETLASNATRTSFGATDIFINWHSFPGFNLKAGQFKAPFGLEQLTPDTKLFTAERSLVTTALTPERQIGVQIWGKPLTDLWPEQKDLITYYAGAFNGTGRNTTVNDNSEFMYVGRMEVQALRSQILNQETSIKVGAQGLSSRDETGTSISSVLRENSDGSLSGLSLPSPGTRKAYGFDLSLRAGPFDLVAEYISEQLNPRSAVPLFSRFTAEGYYLQGSYFVLPKKLQLVTKWESFDPDQAPNDDIKSITAGLNYYLKGDDLKLLANYIHTWSDFREANPESGESDFDEVILRLQVMF